MQIVGYDSGVGHLRSDPVEGVEGEVEPPALLIAEEGSVRRERLVPGHELAYTLAERQCAGTHDGEIHDPCNADGVPRCDVHTSTWPCARCTGECDKPIDACDQEHAVYLAAFAPDHVKVGVTRSWRLHARLREQGADRAAHLRTVSDGRVARRIEREMARDLSDRVGIDLKIRGMARSVDEAVWRTRLSAHDLIASYDFDYKLDLTERPMAETLATGTVVGSTGRLLVLERAGSRYAVDLRDLVGYHVTLGASTRDLQASLGAFER